MSVQPEWRERKTTVEKANLWSIIFVILVAPIYGFPFKLIWPKQLSWEVIEPFLNPASENALLLGPVLVLVTLLVGIFVHELIHGITWAAYCQNGWKSIKFGVIWKLLTPYCHCREAVANRHYLKAILMPGFILGFLPAFVAIVIGNLPLLAFGWLFTAAAAGDILMARMLLQENPDVLVKDMDDEPGFWVYDKPTE